MKKASPPRPVVLNSFEDAVGVAVAVHNGQVPWTAPLHRVEAEALIGVVRTAAITLPTVVDPAPGP